MATKIQLRRDTSENWTSINPTLFSGEIGFETNTGKFKIGNGSSVWSALSYFGGEVDLSTYLTISSASTTYLTQASASTTYLTQASASTTYLTQALASNTYQNKNIDIITKSEAYEIASGDENDLIQLSGSNAYTVSIPTDASANFTIGTQINLLNIGTGVKTVAAVTPGTTTVNGTPGLKLRTQWSSATLIKRAANTWVLIGDLAE
jgi:hypothetical protein